MTEIQIRTPLILVNFKTYAESTGKKAVDLSIRVQRVCIETGVCIGLAPQFTDIVSIAKSTSLPLFAQHIDPISPGSFTGHILPEAVKEAGAIGVLINHSERQLTLVDIKTTILRAREVNLLSSVCVSNPFISTTIAKLNPDIISIEPPELIGTGIPVSKAKPDVVSTTIELVKQVDPNIIVLCGAGITRAEDVSAALKLGAEGVLVASGVIKAKNPVKVLSEFTDAILKL